MLGHYAITSVYILDPSPPQGHAQALARNQKAEVGFVIHNLPVIAKMAAVGKVSDWDVSLIKTLVTLGQPVNSLVPGLREHVPAGTGQQCRDLRGAAHLSSQVLD